MRQTVSVENNAFLLFVLECENGTWGEDCISSCGNCITDTTCNHVTGECSSTGCMAGWEGKQCLDGNKY